MRFLIIFLLFIFPVFGFTDVKPECVYVKSINKYQIDSLKNVFNNIINIPSKFNAQILLTLSYFTDLKDVNIEFVYSSINTTMQCRPTFLTILKIKKKYLVIINNNKNFEGLLLDDVPFNAQIGIIGHEFCHIFDYEKKSTLGIIKRGLEYINDASKREYECKIDSLTIERGLGWQLYDWAKFSMYDNTISTNDYKSFKIKIYLQPSSIINYINKIEKYKN